MSRRGIMPVLLRTVAIGSVVFLGGVSALGTVTSVIQNRNKRKYGRPCMTCKGIGFYKCKLCKGSGTIKWSPLHDPVAINPCLCPTCDGNLVQRCLNCLGYGYT